MYVGKLIVAIKNKKLDHIDLSKNAIKSNSNLFLGSLPVVT